MVLVSLKRLWPKKLGTCPNFGIRFLAVMLANWAEIFYGSSGDYYLSIGVEKYKLWWIFFIFYIFAWSLYTWVWGLKTQSKIWPTGWTFWANRYLEIMFSKFLGANYPPPLIQWCIPYFILSPKILLSIYTNVVRLLTVKILILLWFGIHFDIKFFFFILVADQSRIKIFTV